MEGGMKSQAHLFKGFKAFIGKTEKQCNKCGFVTFCLHVLYKHKYKCRGQLLGHPIICAYCKRKFNFITLYKSHKATCLKKLKRQRNLITKMKQKHIIFKEKRQKNASLSQFSVSCPICQTCFTSKEKFVSHLKKKNCKSQNIKKTFSARKSFNNYKSSSSNCESDFYPFELQSKKLNSPIRNNRKQFHCAWCKSSYPSSRLLFMHLDISNKCAKAYCHSNNNKIKKISLTARKTFNVVAKKSFPYQLYETSKVLNYKKFSGSARKTLPSSRKSKSYKNSFLTDAILNPCPICFKEFPDTYRFFLHQKKMNHWGKATKSVNSRCKCPFCGKEFLHVASRITHVRNHADVSGDKIKVFLRNHTCNICSQIFATELAKHQHMRIQHPAHSSSIKSVKYSGGGLEHKSESVSKRKMSSVPSSMKKKLKQQPNSCPVCSKAFSHTVLRNKHFNEIHLKMFECQFCNTKFKSISSLNNHIELSHRKDFECRECKVRFKNELQLLQHVLKSHPNKDPKLFLSVKSKNLKEKTQNLVPEITVQNVEKMNSKHGLLEKNMEYYCDVCDIGFLKLCGLQRHRQSKLHKDTLEKNLDAVHKSLSDLPPTATNPPKVSQPEILICSECSEDFASVKDFVPHRLSHFSVQSKYLKITELNPYMCEICSDVLDSHSKVQLHLFWHLQIESTADTNSNLRSSKKETIVPDRLSGQHVAKKSFSKHDSLQEVVIRGVKKPLFTCEGCNVGFTTKEHYSMHIRKLCKKMNAFNTSTKTEKNANTNNKNINAIKDYNYCDKCNVLFCSPAKHKQHKSFCSNCIFDSKCEENLINSDAIKSAFDQDIAIAGCITCGAIFDSIVNIEDHLVIHQEDCRSSIPEDVPEDVLHCSLCNCLFPLHAFKIHKDYCKIPVNIGDKVTNFKHMNVLKSALELKCAVAGCISCGVPFDDLETFSKHLTLHQTNQISNKPLDRNLCNGEEILFDVGSENPLIDNSSEVLLNDFTKNLLSEDEQQENCNRALDYIGETSVKTEKISAMHLNKTHDTSGNIEDLRENFSQLLCLLISDPELMQTLGYGSIFVEDVLVNVLEQMGEEPCTNKKLSNLERFRKNIKILLHLCLKDQIMEAIGNKKTTDEIVIEALKMFASDESMPDTEEINISV